LGYCNQNSKIFPCYEKHSNPNDKQITMKIYCNPKESQSELAVQEIQNNVLNVEKYINGFT